MLNILASISSILLFVYVLYYVTIRMQKEKFLIRFTLILFGATLLYAALYFYNPAFTLVMREKYSIYADLYILFAIILLQIEILQKIKSIEKDEPERSKKLKSYVKKELIVILIYITAKYFI